MAQDLKTLASRQISWYVQRILLSMLLISNFLPFYITILTFIFVIIILVATASLKSDYFNNPNSLTLFIFSLYTGMVAIIYENWLGLFISLAFILAIIFFTYYTEIVHPSYLEEVINISLVAGFFCFIFALLEHQELIYEFDYTWISQTMSKVHADRVEATFFNPNYYAMILEFLIIMGIYKIFKTKKRRKKLTFSFLTLCNLLATLYTGTRTSFLVILAAVFVFFYIIGYKKQAILSVLALTVGLIIAVALGYLPRMLDLAYAFSDRFGIWETSWAAIKSQPFFGRGPLTMLVVFKEFGGKYTQHAHNLILEGLLSYGIIGLIILIPVGLSLIRLLNRMRRYPDLRLRLALFCALITIVVVHGLTDVTIFWIQTAFLLFYTLLPAKNILAEHEDLQATIDEAQIKIK
ncbi:oligosaccharide repeat unit polymerase [Aerococcus urinaehominis]|uniref:O-antigen ligase family protein n=1 Tax=Aerococcus urinaehominis TaxID=128944 RepID=UPI00088B8DD2|nr:O-antigen ligase family protein [Aerococcus urinaehominis]SDM13936.1 oligosaccharide repeat unit polymerase [Aerococcus urinaehominis]